MVGPRTNAISWDECFMRIARTIADRSKDPSTQAGAVIVNNDNVVVGIGYNGLPRGLKNEEFPWDREGDFLDVKYTYVCHAEENAIFNSNNTPKNCKIYATLFPCNECAKSIVQNGIKEVIYESDKYHDEKIWVASRRILDAAGIKYRQYTSELSK
ncbi:MAG: Deoxycytidylate deaminase [Parcubacteria group bacterium GW2011_GWF2_38_76]|nr:MAG: Deoxycytidylate deaminase [Parcubacteria group bacterium GW2011_GWF2_38_76]HBM45913.1 cytidine deaminase [Patescibacteria group bacterium]